MLGIVISRSSSQLAIGVNNCKNDSLQVLHSQGLCFYVHAAGSEVLGLFFRLLHLFAELHLRVCRFPEYLCELLLTLPCLV